MNYEEAMMSPDSVKWLEAMRSEIGSMYENKVWTCPMIVVLLSTKLDLSQKGFRQVQSVDYDEIFSLSMLKSVQIMLAIAAFYEIWQMDVKSAFLNGFLK